MSSSSTQYEAFDVSFVQPGPLGLNIIAGPKSARGTSCTVNKVTLPSAACLGIQAGDEFQSVAGESVVGKDMHELCAILSETRQRPLVIGFRRVKRNGEGTAGSAAAAGATKHASSSRVPGATKASSPTAGHKSPVAVSRSRATNERGGGGRTTRSRARVTGETIIEPSVYSRSSPNKRRGTARTQKRDKSPRKKAAAASSRSSTADGVGDGANDDSSFSQKQSLIDKARAAAGYVLPGQARPQMKTLPPSALGTTASRAASNEPTSVNRARASNAQFASSFTSTAASAPAAMSMLASEKTKEDARAAAGYKLPRNANVSLRDANTTTPDAFDTGAAAAANDASASTATATSQQEEGATKFCPLLAAMGVPLTLEACDTDCRSRIMAELVTFNAKHSLKNEFQGLNGRQTRMIKLPSQPQKPHIYHQGDDDEDDDNNAACEKFYETANRVGFVEDMLDGLSSVYHCSEDQAAEYVMYYFAKKMPRASLKFKDLATTKLKSAKRKERKKAETSDYQDFDGTGSMDWNRRYSEMLEYKQEHGDCLVSTKDSHLGRWVSYQRTLYRKKDQCLTPKRIELLESIGFVWSIRPPKYGDTGDARFNRAMAARLHYSDLSVRETLLLGGYTEAELDEIPNPKHTWRSTYVNLKDKMYKFEKKWEETRNNSRKLQINKFWNMLKGIEPGSSVGVFGDRTSLIPAFLQAAALRKSQGICRDGPKRKRKAPSVLESAAAPANAAVGAPILVPMPQPLFMMPAVASAAVLPRELPPSLPPRVPTTAPIQPLNADLGEDVADNEDDDDHDHFWTKRSRTEHGTEQYAYL
mmetsp:Transcript_37664/g.82507  ORF Transcript_37664/g.82507 Transcript_37664/m.82507 type:complete len:817 (+) Transcript_37664:180-2630(+)